MIIIILFECCAESVDLDIRESKITNWRILPILTFLYVVHNFFLSHYCEITDGQSLSDKTVEDNTSNIQSIFNRLKILEDNIAESLNNN